MTDQHRPTEVHEVNADGCWLWDDQADAVLVVERICVDCTARANPSIEGQLEDCDYEVGSGVKWPCPEAKEPK